MLNKKMLLIYHTIVLVTALVTSIIFLSTKLMLPEGALAAQWSHRFDHYINAVAMAPFGGSVAIGSSDGQVSIYHKNGTLLLEKNFKDPIQGLFFSMDEETLYVKTYNIFKLDIANNSVPWEKFKANHYVKDFWVYRNGNLGFLFASKTSVSYIFLLTDRNGRTLHEFDLPDLYDSFESASASSGDYLFFATESSDLYHMNVDGMVNWMMRLDPQAIKTNHYPLLFDINQDGEICLAYAYEQYGKKGYMAVYINKQGDILWKVDVQQALISVQFSSDGKKILINTLDDLMIYRKDGTRMFRSDQFGYQSLAADIFPSGLLINYFSKQLSRTHYWTANEELPSNSVLRWVNIDYRKVKWQKRIDKKDQHFMLSMDGRTCLELVRSGEITYYEYKSQK